MRVLLLASLAVLSVCGAAASSALADTKADQGGKVKASKVDVLANLPVGTILFLKQSAVGSTFPTAPDLAAKGWKDCGADPELAARYVRISPKGVTVPPPPNGGKDDDHLFASWHDGTGTGKKYDGGQNADGTEDKRSPGPGDTFKLLDVPEYTYLACIEKVK